MKALLKSWFTLALLLVFAVPVLAATAASQADKVASKMLDFDKALGEASAQIELTLNSMNAIGAAPGSEMASKYKDFGAQVKKLQSMADKAKSRSQQATAQREDYLKQWEASQSKIQNEQLKSASEARRNELLPKIEAVKASMTSAKETFTPFMQDLNDLNLYLGNNLNAAGVTGASTLMEKCNADGGKMKSDIATGQAALKDLAASIQPGGGAPAK
jgi:Skp family chaperone for outer membrane proteins